MQSRDITCIICPRGCTVSVSGEGEEIDSIRGQQCRRGEEYAREEFICPSRILTSTVIVEKKEGIRMMPVRSDRPVPKALMKECMGEIRKLRVKAPVHRYDVLLPDILGTGADIVATGDTDWM